MKKINLLLILIMMWSLINAQTQNIQTYNGSFKTTNLNGTAFYKYLDNNEGRIFDGDFKFTSANKLVNITGKFTNNLKTGIWKFGLTNYLYSDLIFNYSITSNVSGNFENSLLTGNWILQRTKIISFSNNGISEYYKSQLSTFSYLFSGETPDYNKKQTVTEVSNVNFIQNHFAGKFSYLLNNGKSKVIGEFSNDGYLNGTWILTYYENEIPFEETRIYVNGVLSSVKIKDNSTGQVNTKLDKIAETNEFFQNYIPNENTSLIGNQYFKLVSAKDKSDESILKKAIDVWFNNNSISTSSYTNEIQRGIKPMEIYPERYYELDYEKNEEKRLEEKQKEELIKKRKQVQEDSIKQIRIAKENQEREIKYEKDRKRKEFENSDYGKICKQIQTEFNAWTLKGDFETVSDYEKRINSNSTSEFNKIVTISISNSKKSIQTSKRYGILGEYDIDNEIFILQTLGEYKSKFKDTIILKIPRSIAKDVKNNFSGGYYDENQIIVVPQNYLMINNYWILSSAIIFFNGKYQNETWFGMNGSYTIEKLQNGKIIFSSRYPTPELKNYKVKSIKESKSIDNDLYYYEWSILENPNYRPDNEQKLDFNFDNLNIILPKF